LTAGLGGMGGAQPLAVTLNGGACLAVEVDPARAERRVKIGYCDRLTTSLDEALSIVREGRAVSIAPVGNPADVHAELVRRGVVPDVITDQTSAHDPLGGYIPRGLTLAQAAELRERDPEEYVKRARASVADQVRAILALRDKGAIAFDYGNNLRG